MKLNTREITRKLKERFLKPIYLLLAIIVLCSHDLYIKMESYFLQANQESTLSLYNGTFENSENIITRDRILDASIIAQGERIAIKPDQWKDQDSTITQLTFNTGEAGTYVAGVSTKARNIELTADEFNDYLEHDGVLDMLEQRTNNNLLGQDAVESYQKHVKAIFQVGDTKTDDWSTVLGYPIEFVPQANPYEKYSGEKLEVKLLLDGKPLSNQLVYADYIKSAHTHAHSDHTHEHSDHTHAHSDHTHEHSDHAHTHSDHSHEHSDHAHTHSDHSDAHSDHSHEHSDHAHTHSDHSHTHSDHTHTHDGTTHSHDHTHDDSEHHHAHKPESEEGHTHTSGQQLRTNDQGIVLVNLPEDGIYYLRTIHMASVTDSDELTHRSKWATLTFEVSHKHDASTHTHDDHDHEDEIPTWGFVLASVLIIGLLFFFFRTKN